MTERVLIARRSSGCRPSLSLLLALAAGAVACGSDGGSNQGAGGNAGTQSGGRGATRSGGSGGTGGDVSTGGSTGTGGSSPGAGGAAGGAGGTTADGGSDTGVAEGGTGDGGGGANLIDNPMAMPPTSLKDTGAFPAFPDLTQLHPRAYSFKPKHELWSNGLGKARFGVLPVDKKINTSVRDAWDFPVGTLFFKTFFQEPGAGGKPRPVETRLIRRSATTGDPNVQWEFFVYQWNSTGTDATLAEIRNRIPVQVTVGTATFMHDIPKRGDCWNCHIGNKSPIIGFDELRLNVTTPGKTQTQLAEVMAKGWLTQSPTAPFLEITDTNPTQKAVKEWIHGNCAHCHNGEQPLEPGARYPQLDLRWDKFMADTINKRTMTVGTAVGTRIVPGRPVESILFLAVEGPMNSANNSQVKIMPPVGVNVTDKPAIATLRQWIMSLPTAR